MGPAAGRQVCDSVGPKGWHDEPRSPGARGEAGGETRTAQQLLDPAGSSRGERRTRLALPRCPGFSLWAPAYVQQGLLGRSTPSPSRWGRWAQSEEGKEKKVQKSGLLGSSSEVPWSSANKSSQAASSSQNGRKEGTGKAWRRLRLPELCPHVCSVLWNGRRSSQSTVFRVRGRVHYEQ